MRARPYLSPWHPGHLESVDGKAGFRLLDVLVRGVPERLAGKGQTPEGDLLEGRHACTCSCPVW